MGGGSGRPDTATHPCAGSSRFTNQERAAPRGETAKACRNAAEHAATGGSPPHVVEAPLAVEVPRRGRKAQAAPPAGASPPPAHPQLAFQLQLAASLAQCSAPRCWGPRRATAAPAHTRRDVIAAVLPQRAPRGAGRQQGDQQGPERARHARRQARFHFGGRMLLGWWAAADVQCAEKIPDRWVMGRNGWQVGGVPAACRCCRCCPAVWTHGQSMMQAHPMSLQLLASRLPMCASVCSPWQGHTGCVQLGAARS